MSYFRILKKIILVELVERIQTRKVPDFKALHKRQARAMEKTKERAEKERNLRPKSAAPSKTLPDNSAL